MSEDSAAEDQIAAFIDRILRLKAEADDIAADIKEIYAEAHGSGFNKTRLGEIVTYLRKVERDASKVEEAETIRDLYLTAYYRAKNKPLARIRVRDPKTTTEPQPETAVQMPNDDHAPAGASDVGGDTSLAGAEGIVDRHPILEQQPAPQALNGQVATPLQKDAGETIPSDHPGARPEASPEISGKPEATHTLETANEADGDVLGHAVQPVAADHSIPAVIAETTEGGPHESAAHPDSVIDPGRRPDDLKSHSAGGQTNEAVNTSAHIAAGEGAPIASAASLYAEPGEVVMESCPPVGIVTHPYAACWPVNTVDVREGIRQPIVKIGNLILDGRGRYFAARAAHVEYPVVQYDGDDDLADCITWNLASRPGMDPRALRIVAEKLAKLVPDRAEEIMERFGFNEEQRAAQ